MRVAWMCGLLLLTGLSGCLSGEPETIEDTGDVPGATTFVDGADGRMMLATEALAQPWFTYTGYGGAEPNIGITSKGNIFITAGEDTLRSQDGGVTWEVVFNYRMLQGQSQIESSDPMLWVDPLTDRVFTNHMWGLNCFNMIWSDDEGNSWLQRDLACTIPVVDHQKVMTAPIGPDWPTDLSEVDPDLPDIRPTVLYPNVLYTCYNKLVATDCFMSYDGGITYPVERPVLVGALHECAGASGHPAASHDGIVAFATGWNCGPQVAVTTDSGLTWSVHLGPQEHGVGASIDPDVAFGPDNEMYLNYRDGAHMTRIARSDDLGESWSQAWNITAPGLTATRFHVMSAGDTGRVAAAYLGTDFPVGSIWIDDNGSEHTWQGAPNDAPPNATWHLYIATTADADADEPTWTIHQVTPPGDPVQKGCAWEGGGGGGDRRCRNMLDFIDSAVHPDGTFYVVYTEGCTIRSECAYNTTDLPEMKSRDREVAVAALYGWSLYDDLDDAEVEGRVSGRAQSNSAP